MKLVKVVWIDAEDHIETWTDLEDLDTFKKTDCEVTSVGFLVSKNKKSVVLAGDMSGTTAGRVTKIPAKMIQSITPL